MPETNLCKICGKRRARRACPAVHGDICPICCGEHREISFTCPLTCEYLQEAHQREKPLAVPDDHITNRDVIVTEEFAATNEELMLFCIYSLFQAALRTAPPATDSDLLAALEALIQTQRTLASGLVYETISENPVAASIQRSFKASLADYQRLRQERESLSPVRDSDILKLLVFLQRVGQQNQNGRPRGRLYMDLLARMAPDARVEDRPSGIII